MRDPKRIEKTLAIIRMAWLTNPDLRLTQLICNTVIGKSAEDRLKHLYFMEDEELAEYLAFNYDPGSK
jgi:uncharacterized protein YihD (DUF1040 family)